MGRLLSWGICAFLAAIQAGEAQEPDIVQLVQQGERFAAQGKLDQALSEYERAMAAGAGSAVFLNRFGELCLLAGKYGRAVEIFHRSLIEQPGQLAVYSRMGEAFVASGKLDSALYYVKEASRLSPDDAAVHSSLGFLYIQTGDLGSARAQLDTALSLDPDNPEAHRFLGYYFARVDSLEEAIAHYKRLIELVPDQLEPYNNLAFLYARQGKYQKALDYYEYAKKRTDDPRLIYELNRRMEAVRAILDGKMRARYILVKSRTEAVELLERVRKGEDFAQLARQYSQAPNASDGGDVDFFGPGELLPAFEEAVLELKVGEVSDVVEVPIGFLIIQRLN